MSSPTVPPQGLTVRRFHAVEGVRLWLSGVIDEHFPADVFANVHGLVVIDLSGIRRITSFGIREWIRALSTMVAEHVYFAEVASCVVPQFAMVAGFAGNGQILSYQAPYDCDSCGASAPRSFDRRRDADSIWNGEPPTYPCASCGQTMTFADIAESNRIALMLGGPLRDAPGLAAVAAVGEPPVEVAKAAAPSAKLRLTDATGARSKPAAPQVAWSYPFEVHKQVVGQATLLWISGTLDAVAGFRHVGDGLEGDVVVVAPGILACDEAGAEVLRRTTAAAIAAGGRVLLARAAPVLVAALAREPERLHGVTLLSVEHVVSCAHCKRDVAYLMTTDASGDKGVACGRCGTPCKLDNELLVQALRAMPCGATPKWLPPLLAAPPVALKARVPVAPKPRWILPLVGAGVLVLAAGGVGAYLLSQEGKRIPHAVEIAGSDEPAAEPEATPALPTATAPTHAATKRPAGARPTAPQAATTTETTPAAPRKTAHDERKLVDTLETGQRIGELEALPSDDAPALPAQLTRAQLDASMAALAAQVRDCSQTREAGTALVRATVTPKGRLSGIEIGGLFAGTPTGQCVEHAVKQASFPRFSGAPMPLSYSYELR